MSHPQQRMAPLNQFDGVSPRPPNQNIEQFLQDTEATRWSPRTSTSLRKDHEMEFGHSYSDKISVLARVKEKARRWRNLLTKKKNPNSTPSWGVSLDDEEDDEDPDYLGAPMYESEMAPEGCRESARQHPTANAVIPENHLLVNSANSGSEQKSLTNNKTTITEAENPDQEEKPVNKTLSETVTEKLGPAYNTISNATNAITSKIQNLTLSTTDVANSQATSPKKSPREAGVVDKVKEAVTTFIWTDESSHRASFNSAVNSSADVPIPTNAQEVKCRKDNGDN